MSDPQNPSGEPPFGGPPPGPPPMPPAPPPGAFEAAQTTQPLPGVGENRVQRGPGRLAALVVGGAMLAGGTAFAVTSFTGDSGPGSPEEATAELFEAIANEDLLGVLGALDPAERDAVREPMEAMAEQLQRLEVLSDDLDLGAVSGIDFEFTDLEFEVDEVRDDLARVHIVGGTADIDVEGAELPFGDLTLDLVDDFDGDVDDLDTSDSSDVEDGGDTFLVARDTGDGWRISLGYTAAEAGRDSAGARVPDPGDGIEPVGAESPTEAVEELLRSAADFDAEDVIARLSSEMHPLREYADLYLDDLEDALRDASSEVEVDLESLDLEADESGDTALVRVLGFELSVEDSFGSTFGVTVAGDCITLEGDLDELGLRDSPFEDGEVCTDDLDDLQDEGFDDLFDEMGIDAPDFPPFNEVSAGIVAVKEDGRWFVSPVRTTLELVNTGLRALEREHIEIAAELVDEFFRSFEESFTFEDDFGFEEDFDFDDDFPPPQTTIDFDDDFGFDDEFGDFTFTMEESIELAFGASAPCIIEEISLLDPALQDEIRANFEDFETTSSEADAVLFDIFERCGAFD